MVPNIYVNHQILKDANPLFALTNACNLIVKNDILISTSPRDNIVLRKANKIVRVKFL